MIKITAAAIAYLYLYGQVEMFVAYLLHNARKAFWVSSYLSDNGGGQNPNVHLLLVSYFSLVCHEDEIEEKYHYRKLKKIIRKRNNKYPWLLFLELLELYLCDFQQY